MHATPHNAVSPWPHRLAVALVCATFPLIWVGGLVTTYDAGMAVPDWPNTYGYNLLLYPWTTWVAGPWDLFIEHGHRLLGSLAGLLSIALLALVWRFESRAAVRVLALLTLAAVIGQGILGGMRVLLDERLLAQIHACTGPLFFSLAVAMATVTSRWWHNASADRRKRDAVLPFARLAQATTVAAYVQLVLGTQLRHVRAESNGGLFQAALVFHLLTATVLALLIVRLAIGSRAAAAECPRLRCGAWGLAALLAFQLALGAGTWISNYGVPAWVGMADAWREAYVVQAESWRQAAVTTAHVATGSWILVAALALALRATLVSGWRWSSSLAACWLAIEVQP